MPVAVPLIGAAVSIGGGVLAANSAKGAARDAAAAQSVANDKAIAEQQRQYNTTRSDLMPWQTAGTSALGQQGNLLGLNGTANQQSSIDALKASPLYQSLFNNGQEALLQNASATGGLRGGNTQHSLANFGRDTLSAVIENQLNSLGGVSTSGQNAAAQTGTIGANSANNISQLLSDTGTSQANASMAAGKAQAGMYGNIASTIGGLANNSSIQGALGKLF